MNIYAVDFDGTLCESRWPGIGAPNTKLIEHLIRCRQTGDKVILWTCRIDERLQEAVDWCRSYGLEFDAINDNIPENIEKYGNNTRKIYASCYIDDLAADRKEYGIPYHATAALIKDRDRLLCKGWLSEEDRGLICEALEKQISKKPRVTKMHYICPVCGTVRSIVQKHKYCHDCGQALNWGELK